jgi:hypothetical protein
MKTRLMIGALAASVAALCASPAIAQQADRNQQSAEQQRGASRQANTQQGDANQNLPAWFVDTFRGGA